MKVGAQLNIYGKMLETNFQKILENIYAMGYSGIETSYRIALMYRDLKKLLDKNELKLVALHMGMVNLERVEEMLDILSKSNGLYLTLSGAGGRTNSIEKYLKGSRLLNKVGKIASNYGILLCYHNHMHEIVYNARGIKTIVRNTNPSLVKLCVDTYWVRCSGMDPAKFIEEYINRIEYLHLKDGRKEDMISTPKRFCELGRGIIDFRKILEIATSKPMNWVIVEQDRSDKDPNESMRISREFLRKLGY